MKTLLAIALVPLFLTGCTSRRNGGYAFAPLQSMQHVVPSVTPQCVPPPPTGSVGFNSQYNQASAAIGATGQTLQPVPILGSAPTQPRTSSLPPSPEKSDKDSWESANRAGLDLGARDEPRRAMAPSSRQNTNLAWQRPSVAGGVQQVSGAYPNYSYNAAATMNAPVVSQHTPSYSPPPSYYGAVNYGTPGPVYHPPVYSNPTYAAPVYSDPVYSASQPNSWRRRQ